MKKWETHLIKIIFRNRFQVLEKESEQERVEEKQSVEDEVEQDFSIIKEIFVEVAGTFLGRPRKETWIKTKGQRSEAKFKTRC